MHISTPTLTVTTACAGATAIGLAWYCTRRKALETTPISHGTLHPSLQPLKQLFDDILHNEKEGLALAVYCDGELYADLYGGYANRELSRAWEKDTMAVVFSTTKTLGALVIAMLVSRNQLKYSDLVAKYWPEFAVNGKENISVRCLMEHKAGLIRFADEFPIDKANDPEYMARLIERSEPMWNPGSAIGYHATTFGWLVDQLVRKSDPQKRGIAQFYREEILPFMNDKDFFIGLPGELNERVADVVNPKHFESISDRLLSYYFKLCALFKKQDLRSMALGYPNWMRVDDAHALNSARVRAVENVAALGIGTARALASIPVAVIKNNLISQDVWDEIRNPCGNEPVRDIVIDRRALRGHGFFYNLHPTRDNAYLIGHGGHGGQMLVFDPHSKIVIAIIRNGMRKSALAQRDSDRLIELTFRLLDKQ